MGLKPMPTIKNSSAQLLAGGNGNAAEKFCGLHAFAAFELESGAGEDSSLPAGDEEFLFGGDDGTGGKGG